MSRYIYQLRRGRKDDSIGRDDWKSYEDKKDHTPPLEGELVLEYDNGIPRLKIGDGDNEFSKLHYISVDSFILPKPISITLDVDKWETATGGEINTYSQVVTVTNATITPNSKVDLQPNAEQLCDFYDLGIAFTTENNNGVITTYVVGDKPLKSYTIQTTITEVLKIGENEKIYGDTVGGGLNREKIPQADWNQTDDTKVDYIKNKPDINEIVTQIGDIETALDGIITIQNSLINENI